VNTQVKPLVGNLRLYEWKVQTSFDKQDRHQEVCLDVPGFHSWFKNRLEQFYLELAKEQFEQQCMDPTCDKHEGRTSKFYDFSSSPIKHWEKILEVVRVLGLQSEVRTNSIRYRMM
jgi:hypothetical protein